MVQLINDPLKNFAENRGDSYRTEVDRIRAVAFFGEGLNIRLSPSLYSSRIEARQYGRVPPRLGPSLCRWWSASPPFLPVSLAVGSTHATLNMTLRAFHCSHTYHDNCRPCIIRPQVSHSPTKYNST